jgi:hypothetical protein
MNIRKLSLWTLFACAATAPVGASVFDSGASPAHENGCSPDVVVQNANDSGTGSLRAAVSGVCAGGTITFADRFVIDLQSEIGVASAVVIDGTNQSVDISEGDDNLLQIIGGPDHRSFLVSSTGDLTLRRIRISNGTTSGFGGAIRNDGRLALHESRFDGNSTGSLGGFGGGAIYSHTNSILLVDGCTFNGNDALRGSAIFNVGSAELRNSTFSGNVGDTNEGAIQNRGTMLAIHITVANNGRPTAGFGGLFAFNADTTLVNSVFANNVGHNCFRSGGTVTAIGLLAQSGNCTPQITADPELQPLAGNEGATPTHAPPAESVAVDVADAEFCLPTDQRGLARPQGEGCDLGAFETPSPFVFGDSFEST